MAQILQMSANCKVKSIWRSFIKQRRGEWEGKERDEKGEGTKGEWREGERPPLSPIFCPRTASFAFVSVVSTVLSCMLYTKERVYNHNMLLTRSETGTVLFFRFTDGDRRILRICMFGRSMHYI